MESPEGRLRVKPGKVLLRTLLVCIFLYKSTISRVLPRSCRFYPSCSDYASQALRRHGVLGGISLTVRRILRCHPLCSGGFDPVP